MSRTVRGGGAGGGTDDGDLDDGGADLIGGSLHLVADGANDAYDDDDFDDATGTAGDPDTAPPGRPGTGAPSRLRAAGGPLAALRGLLDRPLASYYLLLASVGLLVMIGLVMVFSATSVEAYQRSGNPFASVVKQLGWAGFGLIAFWVCQRLPVRTYRGLSRFGMATCISLMVLLDFLSFLSSLHSSPGQPSAPVHIGPLYADELWLHVGPVQMQPAELAKLGLALWGAEVLVGKGNRIADWRQLATPLFPMSVLLFILVGYNDFGTMVCLFLLFIGLLWASGVRLRVFAALFAVSVVGMTGLVLSHGYRLDRLSTFLDPAHSDPSGPAYQFFQGLYAIANGGWFGVGLGQGHLKWGRLPNGHNDFIFAVIAEELGVVGCFVVLALFGVLAYTGLRIARRVDDPYRRLVSAGLVAWLVGQATINIGGVTGLLPITGLPLPFISDGGSALVVALAAAGILTSFARAEPDASRALHARPPRAWVRLLWAPLPPLPRSRSADGGGRGRGRWRPGRGRWRPGRGPADRGGGPQGKGWAMTAEGDAQSEGSPADGLRSVVLAGGGTGGHIYPLLAFADCLRRHQPDVRITCLGTPKGLESELIPPRGYDLRHVPAYQLPRSFNMNLVRTPDRMWRAARTTRAVLDEVDADVVVGFGGYVAVPAYLAARRRRTPIVIHEVNVPPGVANRLGMRFTRNVALGFPHQAEQVPALQNARVVGVPLRPPIATLDRAARRAEARAHFGLEPDLPTLFVFGASQGARSINLALAGAAKAIASAGVQVLHIIGARNEPVDIPPDLPAPYRTVKFLGEMELGYAAADLALCRGGAITCAETAAVGLPAVYVPLPWGNGEQRRNALPVVERGGGLLVEDSELGPEWIERNVIPLICDQPRLVAMSEAAAGYGRRDGDEALRAFVLEVLGEREERAK